MKEYYLISKEEVIEGTLLEQVLLSKAKPVDLDKWQDKPDSEGWWWHYDPIWKTTPMVRIARIDGEFQYFGFAYEEGMIPKVIVFGFCKNRIGTWCKTYIPEGENK